MKAPNKPKVLAPAGSHVARLVSIIYIGTLQSQFGEAYKVRFTWELPNELHKFKEGEAEKPFVVSKKFTLSMHEKATLRKFSTGIVGRKMSDEEATVYDIDDMLGRESLITITHTESDKGVFADVESANPLPKGMVCPSAVNKLQLLSYEKWDEELFQSLPKFIQEEISKTPEFVSLRNDAKEKVGEGRIEDEENINPDDIPF